MVTITIIICSALLVYLCIYTGYRTNALEKELANDVDCLSKQHEHEKIINRESYKHELQIEENKNPYGMN